MHSPKGYRRHFTLVDFAANHVDDIHRSDCEAKLAKLNERATNDHFYSRKAAEEAGAIAIFNSGIGQVVCRCNVTIR